MNDNYNLEFEEITALTALQDDVCGIYADDITTANMQIPFSSAYSPQDKSGLKHQRIENLIWHIRSKTLTKRKHLVDFAAWLGYVLAPKSNTLDKYTHNLSMTGQPLKDFRHLLKNIVVSKTSPAFEFEKTVRELVELIIAIIVPDIGTLYHDTVIPRYLNELKHQMLFLMCKDDNNSHHNDSTQTQNELGIKYIDCELQLDIVFTALEEVYYEKPPSNFLSFWFFAIKTNHILQKYTQCVSAINDNNTDNENIVYCTKLKTIDIADLLQKYLTYSRTLADEILLWRSNLQVLPKGILLSIMDTIVSINTHALTALISTKQERGDKFSVGDITRLLSITMQTQQTRDYYESTNDSQQTAQGIHSHTKKSSHQKSRKDQPDNLFKKLPQPLLVMKLKRQETKRSRHLIVKPVFSRTDILSGFILHDLIFDDSDSVLKFIGLTQEGADESKLTNQVSANIRASDFILSDSEKGLLIGLIASSLALASMLIKTDAANRTDIKRLKREYYQLQTNPQTNQDDVKQFFPSYAQSFKKTVTKTLKSLENDSGASISAQYALLSLITKYDIDALNDTEQFDNIIKHTWTQLENFLSHVGRLNSQEGGTTHENTQIFTYAMQFVGDVLNGVAMQGVSHHDISQCIGNYRSALARRRIDSKARRQLTECTLQALLSKKGNIEQAAFLLWELLSSQVSFGETRTSAFHTHNIFWGLLYYITKQLRGNDKPPTGHPNTERTLAQIIMQPIASIAQLRAQALRASPKATRVFLPLPKNESLPTLAGWQAITSALSYAQQQRTGYLNNEDLIFFSALLAVSSLVDSPMHLISMVITGNGTEIRNYYHQKNGHGEFYHPGWFDLIQLANETLAAATIFQNEQYQTDALRITLTLDEPEITTDTTEFITAQLPHDNVKVPITLFKALVENTRPHGNSTRIFGYHTLYALCAQENQNAQGDYGDNPVDIILHHLKSGKQFQKAVQECQSKLFMTLIKKANR